MRIGKFYHISCNIVLCRLLNSVNSLCLYVCIYTNDYYSYYYYYYVVVVEEY